MWGRQSMFAGLPFSAVQEFTVYTNASSAEWGWNAGTAVNVVTRSGSNDWHGDFVGMGSPTFSNANIPLAAKSAQETLAQGSGMLSGPIVKDKTYFMVSGQYTIRIGLRSSLRRSIPAPSTTAPSVSRFFSRASTNR